MCGILGSIGTTLSFNPEDLGALRHRGPDSQGYFAESGIFLGHTRLAIQDLSENGNQPMYCRDNRFVIVFNGEIYNHLEIRKTLDPDIEFRSTGDTETVLYAFIKYGVEVLNMLNGIFAFAIYDREERSVIIARDPMGVKPLYIYHKENQFAFASETKAFLDLNIDKDLNPCGFANYLTFLWSAGEDTPFKNVTKLLPGHYILIKDVQPLVIQSAKYYTKTFIGNYINLPENDLVEELDRKLTAAVERQLLSDVPVGFFLSGGLDSSLLVAIAKKLYPEIKYPCFTIDVNEWGSQLEDFSDDLSYAKKVANYLKVELNVVKADIDIVKDFDMMIWHLDEPQADPAPLNVLNIARLAREKGIKVLLGGTAGDDLFSGYRRHQVVNYENLFTMMPEFLRQRLKSIVQLLPMNNALSRRLKKVTNDLDKTTIERMIGYFKWLQPEMMMPLFSSEWRSKLKGCDPENYFNKLVNEIPSEKSLLNKMLNWEQKTFLVDHNLNYTDKMSMAVGVEARVPFLDLELVEFSRSIPPKLKMKGSETKYLLKKVAEKYLPMEVIYRPKTGFGAPVRKWIMNNMDEMIKERLSIDRIRQIGIFDAGEVWKLIEENKSGKIDASYTVWSILAIDSWLTQFNNKK